MTPYYPKDDQSRSYYCPNCKSWWYHANVSCTVLHASGDCCHIYEKPAPGPENSAPRSISGDTPK